MLNGTLSGSRTHKIWFLRPTRMPIPSQGQNFGADRGIRTPTVQGLSLLPLPDWATSA